MIGSPRSTCIFYRPKGMGLGVARYTNRRGSMKDTVGVGKSYPCLDGTCIQYPHSFYLLYCNMFLSIHHLNDIHTKFYSSPL